MKIKRTKLGEINKVIHEPARLYIMSNIIKEKTVSAILLRALTGLSWGNLSAQLAKLEQADYIKIFKQFKKKRPETLLKITPKGKEAYKMYKKIIKNII